MQELVAAACQAPLMHCCMHAWRVPSRLSNTHGGMQLEHVCIDLLVQYVCTRGTTPSKHARMQRSVIVQCDVRTFSANACILVADRCGVYPGRAVAAPRKLTLALVYATLYYPS